jgi:hypothetical protein
MLSTERGPTLLPLVIYLDGDSLDISHVQSRGDVILGIGISGRRCRSTVLESDLAGQVMVFGPLSCCCNGASARVANSNESRILFFSFLSDPTKKK